MKLISLRTDAYMEEIEKHFESKRIAFEKKKLKSRAYERSKVNQLIREALGPQDEKVLTFYGNGAFHHFSVGLMNHLAYPNSNGFTYIHFDHHSDEKITHSKEINCSSFVQQNIIRNLKSIVGIGDWSKINTLQYQKLYSNNFDYKIGKPYNDFSENELNKLKDVLKQIPTDDVYVSCDLDVLKEREMSTAYGQGTMSLEFLVKAIQLINQEKKIISADMLGYYPQEHNLTRNYASYIVYEALYSAFTNQNLGDIIEKHKKVAYKTLSLGY